MIEKALQFFYGIIISMIGITIYKCFYPDNTTLIYLTGIVVAAIMVPIANMIHNLFSNNHLNDHLAVQKKAIKEFDVSMKAFIEKQRCELAEKDITTK